MNARVAEAAVKADSEEAWEALAELVNERQLAIESVFSQEITPEDKPRVVAMGEAVQHSDTDVIKLIEDKKRGVLREAAGISQAGQAGNAYLANDGLGQE